MTWTRALLREQLVVLDHPVPARELAVGANLMAEELVGRGDLGLRLRLELPVAGARAGHGERREQEDPTWLAVLCHRGLQQFKLPKK